MRRITIVGNYNGIKMSLRFPVLAQVPQPIKGFNFAYPARSHHINHTTLHFQGKSHSGQVKKDAQEARQLELSRSTKTPNMSKNGAGIRRITYHRHHSSEP